MAQNIQPGDTVRYLNAVGGGRVTRIEGRMAYVDEDGFETPVLLNECVVVARAGQTPTKTSFRPVAEVPVPEKPKTVAAPAPKQAPAPAPETPEGEKLNLMIAFDPLDIKAISQTTFDTFLVNDSNYYIGYTLMSRSAEGCDWALLAHGTVEPGTQEFLCEVTRDMLPRLERIAFQYIAWKEGKPFAAKRPTLVEMRLDVTKFCKLHCFRENVYFDTPVLALEPVKDDKPAGAEKPDSSALKEMTRKVEADRRVERQRSRPVQKRPRQEIHSNVREVEGVLEVDLHISELLDDLRGLSNAEILNIQIDEFRRVMDAERSHKGRRIVFIHGKGEGVLRQALMKELRHRYKGNDVQDASFAQYGFGATQVTVR